MGDSIFFKKCQITFWWCHNHVKSQYCPSWFFFSFFLFFSLDSLSVSFFLCFSFLFFSRTPSPFFSFLLLLWLLLRLLLSGTKSPSFDATNFGEQERDRWEWLWVGKGSESEIIFFVCVSLFQEFHLNVTSAKGNLAIFGLPVQIF